MPLEVGYRASAHTRCQAARAASRPQGEFVTLDRSERACSGLNRSHRLLVRGEKSRNYETMLNLAGATIATVQAGLFGNALTASILRSGRSWFWHCPGRALPHPVSGPISQQSGRLFICLTYQVPSQSLSGFPSPFSP